jgi:transcriptional regulator with XRE-family HTH domain
MPLSPIDRKVGLLRRGVTMSEIARELEVSPHHVSRVVSGERRSPAVEQAVAKALGLPVARVFLTAGATEAA